MSEEKEVFRGDLSDIRLLEKEIANHRRKNAQLEDLVRAALETSSDEETEVRKFDLIDYTRALTDYNENTAKGNKDSHIILSDLDKRLKMGVESSTAAFANTQLKKDRRELQQLIKKAEEDFKFLTDQRLSQTFIDSGSKENDIAYACNALRLEISALNEESSGLSDGITVVQKEIEILENESNSSEKRAIMEEMKENSTLISKIEDAMTNMDDSSDCCDETPESEVNEELGDLYNDLKGTRELYTMTQDLSMKKQTELLSVMDKLDEMRVLIREAPKKQKEAFETGKLDELKQIFIEDAAINSTLKQIEDFIDGITQTSFEETLTGTTLEKIQSLRQIINV